MPLMDILERYAGAAMTGTPTNAHDDFSAVAAQASPEALGGGIAQALRNDTSGSFPESIAKLFERSDTPQRTGLLAQLIQAVGPSVLACVAGGALSRLGQPGTAVQAADADAVTPSQAGELASAARQNDPGIVDRVGAFYSQHPAVVKALGAAALAIALNHMAKRA